MNISADSKLRESIRNAIEGQIKSITREEFDSIIRDEISKRLKNINLDSQYTKNLISAEINSICYYSKDSIKSEIAECIRRLRTELISHIESEIKRVLPVFKDMIRLIK